jgi:acetyl/propionyl-CoA carboxylase alpha subunit
VYAEDPAKGFLPSPGSLGRLELPSGDGIRIESGVEAGSTVLVHYDSLLFKLITSGASPAEAVTRRAAALERVSVEGVKTTIPFLRRVVASDASRRGRGHTQMVEQGAFDG